MRIPMSTTMSTIFTRALATGVLLSALAPAFAADEHPSLKRAYNLPPSADLNYAIVARQKGISLNGESLTVWRNGDGKYSLQSDTKVPLFGKILEHKSEGTIDDFGIAPAQFVEKRYRKSPSVTTFKRDSNTIAFGDAAEVSYPIKGGEQDRGSAAWQLAALARAAPDKFVAGSTWPMFVAGRRDAEQWTFEVAKWDSVKVGADDVKALHLMRLAPPDAKGQQVDLWLAPSLDWYPVRVKFVDDDGDFVDQTLVKITRK